MSGDCLFEVSIFLSFSLFLDFFREERVEGWRREADFYVNSANSNVYIGYIGWAAGSFATSYALTETPVNNGGTWTDQALVSSCIARR